MEITLDTDINNTPQLFLGSLNISNEINNRYTKTQIDSFLDLKLNSTSIGALTINSTLANFASLNISTLGKLSIGAATATENLSIIGATNVSQISCTTGDAALYLFSGTLGRAAWVCTSTGQVYFKASTNTTGQSIKFQASSLITNLTLNANGSSSFGTNSIATGAIVASGSRSTT